MDAIDRILELCVENHLTDKKLEIGAGLSNASMNKWKKGKQSPNTDNLIAIARYFGVSIDYLVGLMDIRTPATIDNCLSPQEVILIEAYRGADLDGQNEIIWVCRNEKHKAEERLAKQEEQVSS